MEYFEPDMSQAIKLSNGTMLGRLPYSADVFLNRSTIYYGVTGTGKSSAIKEELFLIKDLIGQVVCFCGTNEVNNLYTGIVPDMCIHSKPTRKKLEELWDAQETKMRIYNEINDIDNLRPVFQKIETLNPPHNNQYYLALRKIESIETSAIEYIRKINNSHMTTADKETYIETMQEKRTEAVKNIYKTAISNVSKFLALILTDAAEKTIVKYININPNLLLVFDDVMEDLNIISGRGKSKNEDQNASVVDALFSKGRHYRITIIIATQDDNKMTPVMRKNAHNSIFCEGECCSHFLNNKANSILKEKSKLGLAINNALFSTGEKHYKKIVYQRLGNNPQQWFCYLEAKKYPAFKVGRAAVWAIDDKLKLSKACKKREFLASFS